MADLVITLKGDASDFKKQFDDAVKKLNDFGKSTSQATGYIGGMESQMKLLKTQMRSASESDIPALRTQFLQLRTAIREAQYGSESFTKKIGGEFDAALQKAHKTLFGLSGVVKGLLGGFGLGAIAGTFIQATGAADLLEGSIKRVVQGLRDIGKTKLDLDLRNSTAPLLERAQKLLDASIPADFKLIQDMNTEVDKLQSKLKTGTITTAFLTKSGETKTFTTPMSDEEKQKIQSRIEVLQGYIKAVESLSDASKKAGNNVTDMYEKIGITDLMTDNVNLPDLAFRKHETDMLLNELATGGAPGSGFGLQDRLATQNNKKWIEDYFKMQEQAIDDQERADQERLRMVDRMGARIGQTAEDALSAGLRGGFQDFLQNYLQQTGLKVFSGLVRLAVSSATGGSFGIGNLLGHIFGFAGGGEFYTNGAMPIIVGDNPGGIEKVTVTPISGRGTTGLKNGNIALAGGGSVTSMPMGDGMPEIIFRPIIKFDGYDIAYSLEMPNGGYEKLNRARGN